MKNIDWIFLNIASWIAGILGCIVVQYEFDLHIEKTVQNITVVKNVLPDTPKWFVVEVDAHGECCGTDVSLERRVGGELEFKEIHTSSEQYMFVGQQLNLP